MKMTESHRVMGVRGSVVSIGARSARSGHGLEREAQSQCGCVSQHRARVALSRVDKRGDRSGVPLALSMTSWLVWVMDQWVHHPR
jgi:hypothetical protein